MVLGVGGMGTVYEAYHERLDKVVAVKTVLSEYLDDVGRLRLEREARIGARLRSPHIVEVYDIATSSGDVYLVIERLYGDDLARRMELGVRDRQVVVCASKSRRHSVKPTPATSRTVM